MRRKTALSPVSVKILIIICDYMTCFLTGMIYLMMSGYKVCDEAGLVKSPFAPGII